VFTREVRGQVLIVHAKVLSSFIIKISRLYLYLAATIELCLTNKKNNREQYYCTSYYGNSNKFLTQITLISFHTHTHTHTHTQTPKSYLCIKIHREKQTQSSQSLNRQRELSVKVLRSLFQFISVKNMSVAESRTDAHRPNSIQM